MSTLDFNLRKPTILDFLLTYEEHALKPTLRDEKDFELLQTVDLYISKMITHDYDLSQQKPSLLATGALYVSLKLGEKLKSKQRGY